MEKLAIGDVFCYTSNVVYPCMKQGALMIN